MNRGYFQRLNEKTNTRLWINNPTIEEARLAIEAGAIACTTNPSYAAKMLDHPAMQDRAIAVVDESLRGFDDDHDAAEAVQLRLVTDLSAEFRQLHERDPSRQGFVSMQGNPYTDDDPARIVRDARTLLRQCPNGIVKIPATREGFQAIRTLLAESIPIIVTEVMTVSQAIHAAELYSQVCGDAETGPPYFVTHITGIFDEWISDWLRAHGVQLDEHLVREAGTIIAKRVYHLYKERGYPGIILGGGARARRHFTEFVGGAMDITINWRGMAEDLVADDPEIENRIDVQSSEEAVETLCEHIPAFKLAFEERSVPIDGFASYGPVELFRSMFVNGWDQLVAAISDRRQKSGD